MSADIVNLNKFRKAKERAAGEARAEENRATFGRTKEQRHKDQEERERRDKLLDGARRDDTQPPPDPGGEDQPA